MNYGIQLYSVRDITGNDFEGALRQVSEMGYSMIEPAGFFGNSAEDVMSMMKKYGLKCCSTHTSLSALRDNFKETVAYHKTIGCNNIIFPAAPFKTKDELDATINTINELIPLAEAEGIKLHYHNHSKEFWKNLDGQIPMDEIASRTDILFEIDTFWAFNAGLDPLAVIDTYKDRISFIHLKDGIPQDLNDPESKPQGRSLGLGRAPVTDIIKKANSLGITMVVESEDLSPSGPEEVLRCIEYLKSID